MPRTQMASGLSILAARKVDISSALSERGKAFFRPDQSIRLESTHPSASSSWNKVVQKFATVAAACGLAATVALAPTPAQAQLVVQHASADVGAASQHLVSIARLSFSDLIDIRDRIGLDEATLRDHGMPLLDEGSIARMDPGERILLVGGLYVAAESLEGFDRAMATSRAELEKRGEPPRTRAEEVQAWQRWLDSRGQERQAYHTPRGPDVADAPNDRPSPAKLEDTLQRIQMLVIPRGTPVAEAYHQYERQWQ